MRPRTRQTVIASVLVSCLLVFVAEQVLAQNPTVKGKGKLATVVHQSGTIGADTTTMIDADSVDLLSKLVPLKMTLVITDVIVSNATASSASFFISRSVVDPASLTHSIVVGAGTTFSYNFGTGLEVPAGSQANIFANDQQLAYTVVGYLRKGT